MNLLVVLGILAGIGGIWWSYHVKSADYLAGQKLKQADEAAVAGKGGEAARLCREVMDGKSGRVEEAKKKLTGFIESPPGPPSEAAAVYVVALDLHREKRCPVNNLFDRGKALAESYAESDPAAAIELLEVISPLAPDPAAELALRRALLEKLHARDPNDVDVVSRLASACEQREEQLRLAREGYRVSVLVSYGSFWFPWFMRRLAERPANILFLAKNIFSA